MAHLIDLETGEAAFTFAGSPAWHRLGTPMTLEEQRSLELCMKKAHCDYGVKDAPLYISHNGQHVKVEDWKATVRTDSGTVLGVVGSGYEVIQNAEAFSLAQVLIDLGCRINVMGAIKQGKQNWVLMSMPNATLDVCGDPVDGFMAIRNSHDGSLSLEAIATYVRIVCANTWSAADSAHTKIVRIRHSKSAKEQIAIAKGLMETMMANMIAAGETFKMLASKQYEPLQIKAIIETALPSPTAEVSDTLTRRRVAVADLIFNGKGQSQFADLRSGKAAGWAILNGFTEYFDHERVREAKTLSAKSSALHSAVFGTNNQIKNKVMSMLLDDSKVLVTV